MSHTKQTKLKSGTLIVCYVPNEVVDSYIVPNKCLTPLDLERLKEAHGDELCEPDVVASMTPERQRSLELNAYLRARMNNEWRKYRVPSTLGYHNFVEIQGCEYPLGSWNTVEDTDGKDSSLAIGRVFWFTVEY